MAFHLPYEWLIGTRYLRSTHRSGFVSFVALMSVIGMMLGVAVLFVVLSVLNGLKTGDYVSLNVHSMAQGGSDRVVNIRLGQD
jgi:lipoprotein-releasing system permease protein